MNFEKRNGRNGEFKLILRTHVRINNITMPANSDEGCMRLFNDSRWRTRAETNPEKCVQSINSCGRCLTQSPKTCKHTVHVAIITCPILNVLESVGYSGTSEDRHQVQWRKGMVGKKQNERREEL